MSSIARIAGRTPTVRGRDREPPRSASIAQVPEGARQTILDLGDGKELRGCRARLDFALQAPNSGEWVSVQSPVVIDP